MTTEEIMARLISLPGWEEMHGRLEKTFVFDDFARAAVFFTRLVNPVEEYAHYPRITIAYNRVTVSFTTPEAGALTEKDFLVAAGIEALGVAQASVFR